MGINLQWYSFPVQSREKLQWDRGGVPRFDMGFGKHQIFDPWKCQSVSNDGF